MLLRSHVVGLTQPRFDFFIHFIQRFKFEVMYITFRRQLLDSFEPRRLQTSSEDDVSLESSITQLVYRSKDHSNLKADPRLGGRNFYWATLVHESIEFFVE